MPTAIEPHEHAGCSPEDHLQAGVLRIPPGLTEAQAREYVERLDRWADAARDAFDGGRLDEAESLADRLRTEYPEQIDGYQVRAMVRLRQERWNEAADGFEEAMAIALKHRDDYDDEFIDNLRRDAEHARAHAQGHDSNLSP